MALKFQVIVRDDPESIFVSEKLKNEALMLGFTYHEVDPDYVFTIGGDGTFLKAVHLKLKKLKTIKFIGIHTGSLGFFADFNPQDTLSLLQAIKAGTFVSNDYALVKAEINQDGKKKTRYAVNEVRIENVHHTLVLDVFLNEQKLEVSRGNGVLVATQLGSSGYNKSLGGAIINRNLALLEYTKIAPIVNNVYRPLANPLIVGPRDVLTFNGKNSFTYFGYDSLTDALQDSAFTIKIMLSNKKVTIIHRSDRPYTQILNEAFIGG